MNIIYKFMTEVEFRPIFLELRPKVFSEDDTIWLNQFYSPSEKEQMTKLGESMSQIHRLNLTAWADGECIGWSCGEQISNYEYYMRNSAVLPEFQKMGIYTELLNRTLAKVQELGFQRVLSKHNAGNNAILIPKLKAGFVIQGMEINPQFGTMVNLVYFFNQAVFNVYEMRTGFKKRV